MKLSTAIKMAFHPATELFPDLKDFEFEALKADIQTNGQQQPILLHEGSIVDGRQRFKACQELGITPKYSELKLKGQPVEQTVVSLNLHRRHLTESQRALIAARICTSRLGVNQTTQGVITQEAAAKELGVSVDSLQRARKVLDSGVEELVHAVSGGMLDVANAMGLATLEVPAVKSILSLDEGEMLRRAKEIRKQMRDAKRLERLASIEAKRKNSQPLDPNGERYSVIYADPPWDYLPEEELGYPTMPLADICTMPVNQRAADDAVLFLWCPAGQLQAGLKVIEAWGFDYKTHAVWDKERTGTGVYFQSQHEVLLLATRGNLPEVPINRRPASIFREVRRKPSQKPNAAYVLIEGMYPELNRLELFCRGKPREGWAGWGNECIVDQPTPADDKPVKVKAVRAAGVNVKTKKPANDSAFVEAA